MKFRIDHCYYELIYALLASYDSFIEAIQKCDNGVIVTLHEGYARNDLLHILDQDPLYRLVQDSHIYGM